MVRIRTIWYYVAAYWTIGLLWMHEVHDGDIELNVAQGSGMLMLAVLVTFHGREEAEDA